MQPPSRSREGAPPNERAPSVWPLARGVRLGVVHSAQAEAPRGAPRAEPDVCGRVLDRRGGGGAARHTRRRLPLLPAPLARGTLELQPLPYSPARVSPTLFHRESEPSIRVARRLRRCGRARQPCPTSPARARALARAVRAVKPAFLLPARVPTCCGINVSPPLGLPPVTGLTARRAQGRS